MSRTLILAGLLGSTLVFASPFSAAQAAAPGFCANYARAALVQVRAALSRPRCRGGMEGARWSPVERVHYDWCLGASPGAAEEERAARTIHLERCR
jgi:hypothetical protein